ncbi:Predicted kinase, aminoglycoside phosphotransferase (APT) family [Streptomyces sp. 2224.1]|uniref:aminoglycoside phosphotransferase family protein n=1 Tax=unclassified Streptomyces TaxID=2593676 RepID=UPI000885B64C|nr:MULTISPECIES: aminoglycoside phosphotransferase family protein [unclassified Streptomyces]PBC86346.1 aminoglycoside phosphotransferase (APT) family kinase protein [Streptomyces sp. 2321.6]SDQ87799.1 Predicted kinase, aminoglycoside phosphotransferase (APT) family [Streptomyces sp. KS_16]SED70247.1 Predicted kinase, aminoglycoside phosphotransferase (APT) family [Streptomyces sp. 2112.3]SED93858.1 Predicted kinase, aminoglycoside phosphotransferase (APT) family [Streptomyces sp. 2224.1]SED95
MPSDAERSTGEGFTSGAAAQVLAAACRRAGLDGDGARLIRLGENALFRLAAHPVVVRIARSTEYLDSARGEVQVSRWLSREGFPVTRVVDDLEQPLVVGGHPVTFWHLIEEGARKATYGELGAVLRDLHSLSLPDTLNLPPYPVLDRTDRRINAAVDIPEDDRAFLRKRARELRDRVADLRFESEKGPVHGDAHVQNLMVDRNNQVILIDLERFSFDHPEWDLMVTATEHHSLGWQTKEQYRAFVGAYGWDLRTWSGFATLRAVQEFNMTTWLMQNVSESAETAAEYARRISSLRNEDAPRDWTPG